MNLQTSYTGFLSQILSPKLRNKSGTESRDTTLRTYTLFQPERQQPYNRAGLATAVHGNEREFVQWI